MTKRFTKFLKAARVKRFYEKGVAGKLRFISLAILISFFAGCYRFKSEGFMLYLDEKTCSENTYSYQFSAPLFAPSAISLSKNGVKCDVRGSKIIDKTLFSVKYKSGDTQTLTVRE